MLRANLILAMRRHVCLLRSRCALPRTLPWHKKFLPKTIKFQGNPQYSDAELLAASLLKKGVVLGYTEMQDYSKQLLAT